jgi:uncharacterized protein (UPF0261 family)
MTTVVLVGTLDTKGAELAFVRDRLADAGCEVLVVDGGVMGTSSGPAGFRADISADEVARAGGADRAALAAAGDRSAAMAAMRAGVTEVVLDLFRRGGLDGILAVGGSGGASLAAPAMQALPVGVPKLIVSTMAAGDTRPYVGESDIAMLYPVVDIAGLNRLARRVLANAAAAMAGMATASAGASTSLGGADDRPLVGATMFGVTTPAVTAARERLEALGYEVLVFHATGTGGRAMEALVRSGYLAGVLDVTTTELADELVGGVLSAGPDRLTAAGATGIPQVVSLGALDMVNFGPRDTVPARFRDRRLYEHNASVTLMRTSVDESRELGRILAAKLNAAAGPTVVFVPRGGLSMIDVPGGAFHDPGADDALIGALLADLEPRIEVVDRDVDINDPTFGPEMADRLDELVRMAGQTATATRETSGSAAG